MSSRHHHLLFLVLIVLLAPMGKSLTMSCAILNPRHPYLAPPRFPSANPSTAFCLFFRCVKGLGMKEGGVYRSKESKE
ncbi:MAG: hypothetical protein J3R72DRAFT_435260 [Linnemannia gamsii]|nr:MAG: hypothetical protein J3R72DRAFT_435260 [Linnemannia gamsii]